MTFCFLIFELKDSENLSFLKMSEVISSKKVLIFYSYFPVARISLEINNFFLSVKFQLNLF